MISQHLRGFIIGYEVGVAIVNIAPWQFITGLEISAKHISFDAISNLFTPILAHIKPCLEISCCFIVTSGFCFVFEFEVGHRCIIGVHDGIDTIKNRQIIATRFAITTAAFHIALTASR